jgi:hypothetical protein
MKSKNLIFIRSEYSWSVNGWCKRKNSVWDDVVSPEGHLNEKGKFFVDFGEVGILKRFFSRD